MTAIDGACSKCGIVKNSGKPSCCAPGGDWFGDCGDDGHINANFGHTWSEGIQACRSLQNSHKIIADQQEVIDDDDDFLMETIAMDTASHTSNLLMALASPSFFVFIHLNL